MAGLSLVGTLLGPNSRYTSNISDLVLQQTSQGWLLVSANQRGGGLSSFSVGASGTPAKFVTHVSYGTTLDRLSEPKITMLEGDKGYHAYAFGLTYAGSRGAQFDADGAATRFVASGLARDTITATTFDIGSSEYVLASRAGTATFQSYRRTSEGTVAQISSSLMPTGTRRDAKIDDIEVATVGGQKFAIATSTLGNFISAHKIDTVGRIQTGQVVGLSWQAPFMNPRETEVATVADKTFVIVAGATSSSLTVLRLDANGRLTPVDHILDEAGTRFSRITELETATLNGRTFVFAAGADDGISMFTLLPDGRLVHVGTIADTAKMALANVSGLAAGVIKGEISVFAGSSTDQGISQFKVSTGVIGATGFAASGNATGTAADDILVAQAGTVQINGGGGDDTLVAAGRPVILTGGAGADVFMPTAVIGTITITDFDRGQDRLDLSDLGMTRSPMQMSLTPTSSGLRITFGATTIDVRSADGRTLPTGIVNASNFPIAHYPTPGNSITLVGTAAGDWINAGVNAVTSYGLGGNDTLIGGIFGDRLNGGDGNDQLFGKAGHDWITGDAGNDRIYGEWGNDTLLGQLGNDLILGGPGDDSLQGGAGNDTLAGEDGNDLLSGEDGNDNLQGSAGNDVLLGGLGNDTLAGGAGNDVISASDGTNRLSGDDGNDTLLGGAGMDQLYGGGGNDYLGGGRGRDLLSGGAGNDALFSGSDHDTMLGDAGDDRLFGEDGNDRIDGGTGNDLIVGGLGNDTLSGADGNDTILGHSGNNYLMGGSGNDTLSGGGSLDTLVGGLGHDYITGAAGRDRLWGEDGNDTLSGGADNDLLRGHAGDDRLLGDDGDDYLEGGLGNDIVNGGRGNDVALGGAGNDQIIGWTGNDRLRGDAGNDTIYGGLGNDIVWGQDGNDKCIGDAGNDRIDGGVGNDTLSGGIGLDTINGDAGNDMIAGDAGADFLLGGSGNDTLLGGLDNDRLIGGYGNDRLNGGDGNDSLLGQFGANLMSGDAGNDTLVGAEGSDYLSGGAGNDLMLGNSGNDTLLGGDGSDSIAGGRGRDILTGGAGADRFVFNALDSFTGPAADVITDFSSGYDKIDLRGLNCHWSGTTFAGGSGSVIVQKIGSLMYLKADMNGDLGTDFSIMLTNGANLLRGDVLI